MNSFEHLETRVVLWHHDRNLIAGSTDAAQHTKLVEEVKELETNILLSQPVVDDIGAVSYTHLTLPTKRIV